MTILHNPRLRKVVKKIVSVLLPVFSAAFLLGATTIIVVIMNGYSIDIYKQTIIKTGVLNIETNPFDADITINETYYGKSNKAIPNLPIGSYTVTLSKQGYHTYKRPVDILHGLASPVIVPLLKVTDATKVVDILPTAIITTNSTGYYILSPTPAATTTPTPTVTNKAKPATTKETSLSYTLTHAYITKPLFDDPRPVTDETMTITSFTTTPITNISLSPTGKLALVTLTERSGTQSLSLIPFKKGTTVNANLADVRVLTFYKVDKKTTVSWSDDGDYLLVDTPTQLISYNVKTATRIILLEKQQLAIEKDLIVWNKNASGIVFVKRVQGTDTNTYEINEFSYNGNPLTPQAPIVTLPNPPENVWSFTEAQRPIYAVSTKGGTYAIGKMYDSKIGEYELSLASTEIAGLKIQHNTNDFSQIQLTSTSSFMVTALPAKFEFTLVSADKMQLSFFNYNRRAADHLTTLGLIALSKTSAPMSFVNKDENNYYAIYNMSQELHATDTLGKNDYKLQAGVTNPILGPNNTALLYTGIDGNLFFKILR